MSIELSVKALHETEHHRKNVDEFSRECYDCEFPRTDKKLRDVVSGVYHYYDTFEIVAEDKIKVKYKYGGGDMEFADSFIVDLSNQDRIRK